MRPLTDIEYDAFGTYVKCPWLKCAAGMGMAGRGDCCFSGRWDRKDCAKFQAEEDFLAEGQKREEEVLPF